MRYKLDLYGYVSAVSFGCYLNNCAEYTGEIPVGYNTLEEWADNAYINAYYISNGNLTLDSEKLSEIKRKEEQEAKDNAPLIRKDLYETNEELESQYKKATVTGKVVTIENPKSMFPPRVKITGVNPLNYPVVSIYTQGKNMLPLDAKTETISGIAFTVSEDGKVSCNGRATADIEYTISGSAENTEPLFVLKANTNYYFSVSGNFEMRYFDGETTQQQYVGGAGVLKFDHDIKVTHVVRKIPSGTGLAGYYYNQLYVGNTSGETYQKHKRKVLDIDFSEVLKEFPYDPAFGDLVIENGIITLVINGVNYTIGGGYVGLFEDFNTIYATEDVTLEVTYSTNIQDVESLEFLQGKSTTTNKFKILEDGSIEAHNGYFSGNIETNNIAVKDGGWLSIGDGLLMSASGGVQGVSSQFGQFMTSGYTFATRDGNFAVYNGDDYLYHLSIDGDGFFGGTVWCSDLHNSSRAELKKNFTKLKNGLDIINSIDIYKYNLAKETDEHKKHIGLVIGDDFRYSKEVTDEKDTSVNLYSLISVCVKAIQEQQEQINQLKEELEKLK